MHFHVCICFLPLPAFHMSQYHGGWSHYISRWHLIEHSCSTLNAPTFCIHVNQATPHKDFRLTTIRSLSVHKPPHALITWTKVNLLRIIPFCYITFSGCPSFQYFASIWFHAKMFNFTVLSAIATMFVSIDGGFYQSSSQSVCLLMFEIQITFICLQPKIQIKLISHVFSTSSA